MSLNLHSIREDGGGRTRDPQIKSLLLYQLSYILITRVLTSFLSHPIFTSPKHLFGFKQPLGIHYRRVFVQHYEILQFIFQGVPIYPILVGSDFRQFHSFELWFPNFQSSYWFHEPISLYSLIQKNLFGLSTVFSDFFVNCNLHWVYCFWSITQRHFSKHKPQRKSFNLLIKLSAQFILNYRLKYSN